jgi:hypothetical protein
VRVRLLFDRRSETLSNSRGFRPLSEKPKMLEIRVSMPMRQDAWQEPWNRSYSKGFLSWGECKYRSVWDLPTCRSKDPRKLPPKNGHFTPILERRALNPATGPEWSGWMLRLLSVSALGKWRSSIRSLLSLLLRRLLQSCPPSEGRFACAGTSLFRAESCSPHLSPFGTPQFS